MKFYLSSITCSLVAMTMLLAPIAHAASQTQKTTLPETKEQRDQRMSWWHNDRFGMFVHWGLYSVAAGQWKEKQFKGGGVEWIQQRAGVPTKAYADKLTPRFKPDKNFAQHWARTAKLAGCRYLVFTTKHHEGFALHDSKVSDYDAMDVTQRDLVKEIVEACRAEGLRIGFYHSVIDWHHPDAYVGMGLPSIKGDTNEGRDHSRYVEYLHAQVNELFSNYGKIDCVWWDYSSRKVQGDSWRADELLATVRQLQPDILSNNRLYAKASTGGKTADGFDYSQGDFITPEQKIPDTGLPGINWETCMTMNGTWGYSDFDHNWKSSTRLIQNLIDIVSKGGNYLLNVGPMANGLIPEPSIERMSEIGTWMTVNGESIYGTQASIFGRHSWGRTTIKYQEDGNTAVYLHIFGQPTSSELLLPGLKNKIISMNPLDPSLSASFAKAKQTDEGVVVELKGKVTNPHATVIRVVVKGEAKVPAKENT